MFNYRKNIPLEETIQPNVVFKKEFHSVPNKNTINTYSTTLLERVFQNQNISFATTGPNTNTFSPFPSIQINPISQTLYDNKNILANYSKGIINRTYETLLGNTGKKAWVGISALYASMTTHFLYTQAPALFKTAQMGEISMSIIGALMSGYVLFGAIPLIATQSIAHISTFFQSNITLEPEPLPRNKLPHITVTIPTYNEPFEVLKNTSLRSALKLDYPKEKLEIVILSNGPQKPELEKYCHENNIVFIHRDGREGGKARNLNISLGLKPYAENKYYTPKGNLFLQIDSDTEFDPDLLIKSAPEFHDNEKLPFLVFETVDNSNDNLFNKSIGELKKATLKLHANIEKLGHTTSDGQAILYQRNALQEVNGWREDLVGEDWGTGFFIRSLSNNWTQGKRIGYAKVYNNSPEDLERFKIQQTRWAKGQMENMLHVLPAFRGAAHIPWNEKADLNFRLTGYVSLSYITTIAPILIGIAGLAGVLNNANFALLQNFNFPYFYPIIGLSVFNAVQTALKNNFKTALKRFFFLVPSIMIMTSAGLGVTKGIIQAFTKDRVFHVTPKGASQNSNELVNILKKNYKEIVLGGTFLGISFIFPQLAFKYILPWFGIQFLAAPFFSLIKSNKEKNSNDKTPSRAKNATKKEE